MNGKGKGSAFERSICTQLSLWWTEGERQDIFWRSTSSGARATVRGRKGQKTAGQYGDICAIDPIGQPLIDLITWEVKRGYNSCTIADLLDKPEGAAKQGYEKWFEQAEQSQKDAISYTWVILHKRDRREAMLYMPDWFWHNLSGELVKVKQNFDNWSFPSALMEVDGFCFFTMPWRTWLKCVPPSVLKALLKRRKK